MALQVCARDGCDNLFTRVATNQKYCSKDCAWIVHRDKCREYQRLVQKNDPEHKRAILRRWRTRNETCVDCGKAKIVQGRRCAACNKKWRAAYQHRYYHAHKDQALEYQRVYNQTYRRSRQLDSNRQIPKRQVIKEAYNVSDIQRAPTGRCCEIVNKILSGEYRYVRS